MTKYRVSQFNTYHHSLVFEFFSQLEHVIDVLRGRADRQTQLDENIASLLLILLGNGGMIGSMLGGAGSYGLKLFGQRRDQRNASILTPAHLFGQWDELKNVVEETAEAAVLRYRHILENYCNEEDALALGLTPIEYGSIWLEISCL